MDVVNCRVRTLSVQTLVVTLYGCKKYGRKEVSCMGIGQNCIIIISTVESCMSQNHGGDDVD